MKRILPRALSVFAAALLACTLAPSLAHADDGASSAKKKVCADTSPTKVGRSGLVYRWKKDC